MPAPANQLRAYLSGFPEKTLQKGRRIYEQAGAGEDRRDDYEEYDEYDDDDDEVISITEEGPRSVRLSVPSQSDYYSYEVKLSWTSVKVTGRCDCRAFEDYGPCKHIVAAVYFLLNQPGRDAERNANIEEAEIISEPTPAPSAPVLREKVVLNSAPGQVFRAIDWRIGSYAVSQTELRKIIETNFKEAAGIWDFTYRQSAKERHTPRITYDRQQRFTLSCSCAGYSGLCTHLFAAASYLYDKGGQQYFVQFRDFSEQKTKALAELGLDPADPEAAEVRFSVDVWGNLAYQAPAWLWPATGVDSKVAQLQQHLGLQAPVGRTGELPVAPPAEFVPAVVFQTATNALPFLFELTIVNTAGGKFTKLSTGNSDRLPELKAAVPREVFTALLGIAQPQLNTALKVAGHYQQLPGGAKQINSSDRAYTLLQEHYTTALRRLWPWLSGGSVETFATGETRITSRGQSRAIRLHPAPVIAGIFITMAGKFIELRLRFHDTEGEVVAGNLTPVAGLLLRRDDDWYLPADDKTLRLLQQFPGGFVRIPASSRKAVFGSLLPSLRAEYEVDIDPALQVETIYSQPVLSLHLSEQGNKQLVLTPRFTYKGQTVYYEESPAPLLHDAPDGAWQEIVRDEAVEKAFAESIRDLHPLFAKSAALQSFFIPFAEALRDSWYQKLLAQLAERSIIITGIEALQHFRYNKHAASVHVSSGEGDNGIDWFDLKIEISFGDQRVSLKEVRRALMQGQAGVRLEDGTIGLLPEDFVREYGALLKLGTENKDGGLRVSKLHFTLIDALHEAALGRDMSAEIAAKKEALRGIENIRTVAVPEAIRATLRPYQAAGYQWLQVLHKLGWGGCLADDMGLGKTLQAIAFLQYLKDTQPGSTHLVVCPTSLIYNWQSELEKFAPTLRYHIHYGAGRVWDESALEGTDVVITSYGIMRSDLASLAKMRWHYVILDESQAIKNPEAQTTKAAQALPATARLCLSGTPLQNNTFDLYAQFQFLNPGLLGSRESFRTDFANPIDKHAEEGPRATLRQMLAPFMLRRTKEQVAKDLPDKTEATLWCEMEPAQRAVYDEYRHFYRDSLLQRIDAEGMAGAAIYVLEALLRLRQLCDHPALVKNKAVKTAESIKLDELRREIGENTGGRKVLVFSQFTEMLALIKKALEEDGISYAYLDGRTPATKRREEVERFQSDAAVQVFLISLKAGGVGLNLTAAEYVYLVDPWWNPAVEAQAIDRTHRIGQTNKIVAYRMICKDTVEEKVMQLQARKRALAEGLVTEDAGFVKKLTREDVAFLLD